MRCAFLCVHFPLVLILGMFCERWTWLSSFFTLLEGGPNDNNAYFVGLLVVVQISLHVAYCVPTFCFRYVLETVASGRKTGGGESKGSNGLVIVSSANCGRLDRATNFLMSVRRTSGAKVRRLGTINRGTSIQFLAYAAGKRRQGDP